VHLRIILARTITPSQRAAVRAALERGGDVARLDDESKELAYQHLTQAFPNDPDLVGNVSPSTLFESFRVWPKDPTRLRGLLGRICPGNGWYAPAASPSSRTASTIRNRPPLEQQPAVSQLASLAQLLRQPQRRPAKADGVGRTRRERQVLMPGSTLDPK
jgi:hypothetical protein